MVLFYPIVPVCFLEEPIFIKTHILPVYLGVEKVRSQTFLIQRTRNTEVSFAAEETIQNTGDIQEMQQRGPNMAGNWSLQIKGASEKLLVSVWPRKSKEQMSNIYF